MVRALIGVAVAALLCVGCGGAVPSSPTSEPADATAPSSPQRVVTAREVELLSGLDCSTTPCPAVPNLQCLTVDLKRTCFFVVAPTDGCIGIRTDRTSAGETIPIVCVPQCGLDVPGVNAAGCPTDLSCVNDGGARYCLR